MVKSTIYSFTFMSVISYLLIVYSYNIAKFGTGFKFFPYISKLIKKQFLISIKQHDLKFSNQEDIKAHNAWYMQDGRSFGVRFYILLNLLMSAER